MSVWERESIARFISGIEGCDTPFDLGWKHGFEDLEYEFAYRPEVAMTEHEMADYQHGYREAHRGW